MSSGRAASANLRLPNADPTPLPTAWQAAAPAWQFRMTVLHQLIGPLLPLAINFDGLQPGLSSFTWPPGALFALLPNQLELLFGKVLNPNKRIPRPAGSDELVELGLNGRSIPILRVLNKKNHQKRDAS